MLISAISSFCVVPQESCLLIRTAVQLDEDPMLMTFFNLNTYLKSLSQSTVTLGLWLQHTIFFKGMSVTVQSPVVVLLLSPFYRK